MIFLPITYVRPDTSIKSRDTDSHSHSENIIPTKADEVNNPHNLVVGSAVQYHNTKQYGIIKWIGTLQGTNKTFAGVEMVIYYLGICLEEIILFTGGLCRSLCWQ